MQKIIGNNITLTRGDTFKATVTMTAEDGSAYTPEAGDVIRFAMKRSYRDADPLITKTLDHASMLLQLDPADTKELSYGDYVYDIELTYENGDVDTFIDKAKLTLTEEVD